MSREDDEIQVLGEKTTSRKKIKKLWILITIILIILCSVGYLIWNKRILNNTHLKNIPETQIQVMHHPDSVHNCLIDITADTINDVPLTIFRLTGAYAQLTIGLPDTTDQQIVLALPAADVRKDKLNILGDFIINGKRLGSGKRKEGCVLINQGALWLGLDQTDESCDYCNLHQASMFRQYPLVINGQVYSNKLKGKSLRRAIAKQKNNEDIYIVTSNQRESLHDFSEALADHGFSNAIYLPGGDAFGFYHKNGQIHYIGSSMDYIYPNSSFIIFK